MGRKPLDKTAKLDQLRILLTSDERAELDAAASSAGQPTSSWARDLLLAAARSPALGHTATKKARTKPAK